ncbi:MAG: hypothetical protein IMZ44_09305 [Planctomycetes bacterium]|nr:hypothetical protein [Planctomycetota bacterium]
MGTLGRERALSTIRETFDLEEWAGTVYAALDDALAEAGVGTRDGKLLPRPGPAPDVDDREVLGLAVLQELLGFESDHEFCQWFESNAVLRQLFPRRLTRPNWADRRALLTPLLQRLSQAFCALDGEEASPFSSSTRIRSMSAARSGLAAGNASAASPNAAIVHR